jgi:hypothetical protein
VIEMGSFGTIARTIGGAGNDIATAKQNISAQAQADAENKLKLINAGLQNQELQARLKTLGQPTVDKDKLRNQLVVYANVPGVSPSEKKVYQALIDSLDRGDSPDGVAQNLSRFQLSKGEAEPPKPEKPEDVVKQYSDALASGNTAEATRLQPLVRQYLETIKPPTEKTPSEYDQKITNYLAANGLADTPANRDKADQVLGTRNKTNESGGIDLDALAQDVASGRATMPTGKFGAQVATRMKQLGLSPPLKKDVPADVKQFINAPVPVTPSVADSQRLAAAADKVFGGAEHRQDLLARGRRSPLMGLRSAYAPQAYDAQEYKSILDAIKLSVGDAGASGGSDAPPGVDPKNVKVIK